LIKIIIKEENFKWHLEAFASELFIYYGGGVNTFCFALLQLMGKKRTTKLQHGSPT